jgi:hypothetical protein
VQKKLPKPYPMKSFAEKVRAPGNPFEFPPTLVSTDLLNFGSEVQTHLALVATLVFLQQHGRLPAPNKYVHVSFPFSIFFAFPPTPFSFTPEQC